MRPTLHSAYSVSRRNGRTSYRCRAYVKTDLGIVAVVIGLGDSAAEARVEAFEYVRAHFARAGRADVFAALDQSASGLVSGARLDALLF